MLIGGFKENNKKSNESVKLESAHGGSGSRKLYVSDGEIGNIQGMTYGWLPAGNKYAWHNHEGIDEIMFVIKGKGIVRDEDGEYEYKERDVFVYPTGVYHEIDNVSDEEHEYIFLRVKR